MSTLHLIIGPVGAGKTTFGRQRAAQGSAVFLDLDTWMVRLFGNETRPKENVIAWYMERRERCRDLQWDLAREIVQAGTNVFLELGLVSKLEREAIYAKARDEDLPFAVYLLELSRDERRERVAQRNRAGAAYTQIVPPEFFELASDVWEPPAEAERHAVGIIDV